MCLSTIDRSDFDTRPYSKQFELNWILLCSFQCGMCASAMNNSGAEVPFFAADVMALPRITSGFHLRLKKNVLVDSKTFIELHSFHQVSFNCRIIYCRHAFFSDQFVLFIQGLFLFSSPSPPDHSREGTLLTSEMVVLRLPKQGYTSSLPIYIFAWSGRAGDSNSRRKTP